VAAAMVLFVGRSAPVPKTAAVAGAA